MGSPSSPRAGAFHDRPLDRDAASPLGGTMSETAVVHAEKRDQRGKGPARRLRQKALIPAVVYGLEKAPTHLAVDPKALEQAIDTPRKFNTLLTLQTPEGDKLVL